MTDLSEISDRLHRAGIRPSVQRMAIMKFLAENRTHPTVDTIYSELHKQYPSLSRTTVYNTVWLLAANGVITEIDIDRGNTRFDYDTSDHAHFKCRRCGNIYDVDMPELQHNIPSDFTIKRINVSYEGLCRNCSHHSHPDIID